MLFEAGYPGNRLFANEIDFSGYLGLAPVRNEASRGVPQLSRRVALDIYVALLLCMSFPHSLHLLLMRL